MLATGSRPRIPDWAAVDGERILTTREAYPPAEIPEHLCVIGSGVTGVEFTHMFSALGLAGVARRVAPAGAAAEGRRGRRGARGRVPGARGEAAQGRARAKSVDPRRRRACTSTCDDGRRVDASHVVLAIGSVPNTEDLGLDDAGVEVDDAGYVAVNHNCLSNVGNIYAAGDLSGKLPLSSVAAMQGRKIAEHLMGLHVRAHRHLDYEKASSAIFTEPEIADVGLAEAEAFASGRKIRVTKVPFSANAKALIKGDARGFVKIISDPATGVVLGGSIVGRNAAELISVIAVAVTNGLKVVDIVDSLLVHPALSESSPKPPGSPTRFGSRASLSRRGSPQVRGEQSVTSSPRVTVTAWPPRTTRSPSTRHADGAAARRGLVADELGRGRGARPRTGASAQCAEPVTGSSSMPTRGREVAGHEVDVGRRRDGAVTITPGGVDPRRSRRSRVRARARRPRRSSHERPCRRGCGPPPRSPTPSASRQRAVGTAIGLAARRPGGPSRCRSPARVHVSTPLAVWKRAGTSSGEPAAPTARARWRGSRARRASPRPSA